MHIAFRNAFEPLDHETRWCFLEACGLHGRILDALKASYADLRVRVTLGGKLGPEFSVGCGVKQARAPLECYAVRVIY